MSNPKGKGGFGERGQPAKKEYRIDESPDLRADMRHVYSGKAPQTFGQKECLDWLKSDKRNFMAKLADLEKVQRHQEASAGEGAADEGAGRAAAIDQQVLEALRGVRPPQP